MAVALATTSHVEAYCTASSCVPGGCCLGLDSAGFCFDPSSYMCCTSLNEAWQCPLGTVCSTTISDCISPQSVAVPSQAPSPATLPPQSAKPSPSIVITPSAAPPPSAAPSMKAPPTTSTMPSVPVVVESASPSVLPSDTAPSPLIEPSVIALPTSPKKSPTISVSPHPSIDPPLVLPSPNSPTDSGAGTKPSSSLDPAPSSVASNLPGSVIVVNDGSNPGVMAGAITGAFLSAVLASILGIFVCRKLNRGEKAGAISDMLPNDNPGAGCQGDVDGTGAIPLSSITNSIHGNNRNNTTANNLHNTSNPHSLETNSGGVINSGFHYLISPQLRTAPSGLCVLPIHPVMPNSNIPDVYRYTPASLPTGVSTLPPASLAEIDLSAGNHDTAISNVSDSQVMQPSKLRRPSSGFASPLRPNGNDGHMPPFAPPNYFDTVADMYSRLNNGQTLPPSSGDVYEAGFVDGKSVVAEHEMSR
ncbi:hypothetical protein SeMB42_g06075 [Synchytrium endobioticum]|uniref:Uncharacterized protein n=1 Tax=Synchytrium endobioticum TaxID=286115 RepID=A0A507CZY9_9FUNG|nr:hypothetical protein SeMB42_g06075 [Synchytrium endobioticum]TPX44744.1 hypothetical protein SeLEV6574_g04307 [Synchytrium endobioticum]